MITAEFTVETGTGLHARPAAVLVAEARRHPCALTIEHNGRQADAKSIIQVLALGVSDGARIRLTADGEAEADAMGVLTILFQRRLRPDGP